MVAMEQASCLLWSCWQKCQSWTSCEKFIDDAEEKDWEMGVMGVVPKLEGTSKVAPKQKR